MQLVEQHLIGKTDSRYTVIDEAAFKAKNLYNTANYLVRQPFIQEQGYLDNVKIFHLIKGHEAYKALPDWQKSSPKILQVWDRGAGSRASAALRSHGSARGADWDEARTNKTENNSGVRKRYCLGNCCILS